MEYVWLDPDRNFRGPVHWGHCIDLIVKPERKAELTSFLNEVVGENKWRMKSLEQKRDTSFRPWFRWLDDKRNLHRLKFTNKDHVIRVKLMWDECVQEDLPFKLLPLVGVSSGVRNAHAKTQLNSMYGLLNSGKSSGIQPTYSVLKSREITESAKKIQCYFDYESGFLDFDSVRAKGAPIGSNPCNEIPLGPTAA